MLSNSVIVVWQMLVIILIWQIRRVKKIGKLKRNHHFVFHCKTYNFTKFLYFLLQIAKFKRRQLVQIVKIATLIGRRYFFIYVIVK
jgi:hypothetical protein